jgi:hypothetical protein
MASANRLKVPDPGELVIVQLRFVEQSRRLSTSILVIANSDVLGAVGNFALVRLSVSLA